MKKTTALILVLAAIVSILSGCLTAVIDNTASSQQKEDNENQHTSDPVGEKIENIDSDAEMLSFESRLIKFIDGRYEGRSYMVSPLSFRYALGLLLPGAKGETKTELMSALGITDEAEWERVCTVFNGFAHQFNESVEKDRADFEENKNRGYISSDAEFCEHGINVANSVWKKESIKVDFKPAYKSKINDLYSSEYKTFAPGSVVKDVNAWSNDKTKGLIPRLLPDDYDASDLAIILMNALYFKDSWVNKFEKAGKRDFTAFDGTKTEKEFMSHAGDYLYYADGDTQLVIVPMNYGVYMTFVLGDASDISEKTAKAKSTPVKVTIPMLDLETTFDNGEFCDFLKENGVDLAFSGDADFSDMIDCPVCVDDIIQKTRIKLDENGVEAAAVTAIMMKCTSVGPTDVECVDFTADRPFSFFIYTTANDVNEMMFAGKIVE